MVYYLKCLMGHSDNVKDKHTYIFQTQRFKIIYFLMGP